MKVTSQCYEEFDDVTKNSALVVFRSTKSGLKLQLYRCKILGIVLKCFDSENVHFSLQYIEKGPSLVINMFFL